MDLRTRIKRVTSLMLSAALVFGNGMSCMTTYAVSAQSPVNKDGTTPNGNKPQDTINTEGTYINDTPGRLQISKVKTEVDGHEGLSPDNTDAPQKNTITYKISGRVEGAAADLLRDYGAEHIELAYSSSNTYLGYGWLKGTLEYLENRKTQNLDETMQIMYNAQGVFEGYAYVTRTLETADDVNRYVAGAEMALYDAVEIFRNPEVTTDGEYYGEDERFTGVTVERDAGSNNVTNVYVNKGYAGTQTMYVLQKEDGTKINIDSNGNVIDDNYNYQDEINDTGNGVWIAKTIQREDTPILFYSLDNLHITTNDTYVAKSSANDNKIDEVFGKERYNKSALLYGFDKEGNVVNIDQKNERDFSIFAFEDGTSRPVYEFVGGDFHEIKYSQPNKTIQVGKDTIMYHLDENGNRDAMVDPQTGIAYIEEAITPAEGHDNIHDVNDTGSTTNTKIYVWPVNVFYDGSGANQGNASGSRTFQKIMTTRIATINADTKDEYTTGTLNGNSFDKSMNPVLDQYGHVVYYRKSDGTYVKGEDRYDYDGDEYIGYTYKDSLDTENEDAYKINDHNTLYNGDNDDPFDQSTHYQYTDKQDVKVTVDKNGNYIVNGSATVPVPVRDGYVFAGWLVEPNRLSATKTAKARWQNANGSGMDETENAQWYSDRAATGETETVTVTFDANGGEFKSGSGDIHSTDNILYRRLGDAYLMENVWTTGENTPNDPFDTQKIDTVKNTAENKDTLTANGQTGNDVYSNTTSGGQADMLKRVNQGTYIMEERKAPAGYVKGLPVGVTVDENTNIQTAEMVDTTVKLEFIKVDAPENGYNKELYINGEKQINDAGNDVTVKETKGQWYFNHVNGAKLALKAKDAATRKSFSDWVKVTGNKNITKKQEDGTWYLEFDTTKPLFLEGIPAGNYTVTEVTTPNGYVTMEAQDFTVTAEDGVQIVGMSDDHTKLEIEKFYNDGTQNRHMPNTDRAGLALIDSDNNTVAEWKTDDLSDYTNETGRKTTGTSIWTRIVNAVTGKSSKKSFVDGFTEQVENGNTDLNKFEWTVTREAVKSNTSTSDKEVWIVSDGTRITCNLGNAPDNAPAAFKEAYAKRNQEENSFTYEETMSAEKDENASKTISDQVWNVSNGTKLHVSIYPINDGNESGTQAYGVSFKFNYVNNYTGKYANMVTYDTIDGIHRFDYIPAGNYTLREVETPSGYVTAADKQITVENMDAVQRYTLENKEKQLTIAKVAEKDGTYYTGTENDSALTDTDATKAAVIPGATIKLYYSETEIADYETAFQKGNVPAGAALKETFVTGQDGVYTESEYRAELIRKDQIGDYRPHTITDLANGYYYVVEETAPDYYGLASVQGIHVTDNTTADVLTGLRLTDTPLPMTVKVVKKNKAGSPLAGATFVVKNKTLGGIVVGTLTTDVNGNGSLNITDTARFAGDGKLDPYTFTINEVSAPAGYTLDPTVHEFTMDSKLQGDAVSVMMVNEKDAAIKNGVLTVTDEESQITISKADFRDNTAVPGAKLVVYEAEQNESGVWVSNGVSLRDDWTWNVKKNETTHAISGLTAGGTYVLREEEYPAGYTKADDVFFKITNDGTGISKIWYDPNEQIMIDFKTDTTGSVEGVEFSTRAVLGTYVTLEDVTNGTVKNLGTLKTGVLNLSSDDITDGNRYRVTEYVKYTDNSEDKLSVTSFIAKLYKNWMKIDLNSVLTGMNVTITDTNGNTILTYTPDGNDTYTIKNPLTEDPNSLTVVSGVMSSNGVGHKAVQPGQQIRYKISYTGKDQEVILIPADGLSYIYAGGLKQDESGNFKTVTDKESGSYTIIAEVKEDASGYINQKVMIGDQTYSYLNAVAINKGTGLFEDTSKLVLTNTVEGTHIDNENAEFTYRIKLTDDNGDALSGIYDYRTRYTDGQIRAAGQTTEFTIKLSGNDFLTISDLPYGAHYSVTQIVTENYPFVVVSNGTTGQTSKNAVTNVSFVNTRNETSERTIFKKNTGYTITENLLFDNADPMVLHQYGFSFGEKCQVKNLTMFNKPTEVRFTKTDWTTCEEVPGAHVTVTDEDGNVVTDKNGDRLEWISGTESKIFVGTLETGKTYHFHEEGAPDGYSYSEDVVFTVSKDGTVDKVVMQDKPVVVSFSKETFAGVEIPGAYCELKERQSDGTDKLIDSWVSGSTAHITEGKLSTEKTYVFHEAGAPDGYSYCLDIEFTIDKNGVVQNAHYINENKETVLYNGDGTTSSIVVRADEAGNKTYWNGDAQVTKSGSDIIGAGGEILVKDAAEEIKVINNVLQMKDAPFTTTLRKEDFSSKELPGATCVLYRINTDGTTTQIDRWISAEDGGHEIGNKLSAGATYRYHEEKVPDGYGFCQDIEFTIDRDGHIWNAHYVDQDGNKLLYDKDGYQTSIIVKPDGTYEQGGKQVLIDGNGDAVDETGTVIANGVKEDLEVRDNVIIMKDAPTEVHLTKVDFTTSKELPGAHVTITDENGEIVVDKEGNKLDWISTNEEHVIKGTLVAGKTYHFHEEGAPDGYAYSEDVVFTVSKDGTVDKVVMKDKPTEVHFKKVDFTTSKELPGAHVTITDENGEVVVDKDGNKLDWISTNEEHVIKGTLIAGKTYHFHEEGAPDGYAYSEDVVFTVSKDGTVDKVVMKDKPTEVHFKKVDFTTSKELPGAHVTITDEDGKIVIDKDGNPLDWISTNEEHVIKGTLVAGKTYHFHEEGAPDGYAYSEDVVFTVSKDGTVDKVVMKDKPTKVSFQKADFAGTEIAGASCTLSERQEDGTDKLIDSWISEATSHIIEGKLSTEKTYVFHEEGAPDGYSYCLDIEFTIDRNGIVQNAHYINENKETILYDGEGNTTSIVVRTDETGNKTYWNGDVQVTKSGSDIIGAGGEILVKDAAEEIKVINNVLQMKDAPLKTTLKKEDFGGKELPGASCILYRVNADGSTTKLDSWVSAADGGHEVGNKLTAGSTYRYHEEGAPDGYGFCQDIEFTIDRNGVITNAYYVDKNGNPVDRYGNLIENGGHEYLEIKDNVIVMKDAPIRMKFLKVDESGNAVKGAKLVLRAENGDVVDAWETDGTPHILDAVLSVNKTYTLEEDNVPDGFYKANAVTFTVRDTEDVQTITMTDETTKVRLIKTDENGKILTGGKFSILQKDTKEVVVPEFTMEEAKDLTGVLKANVTYLFHEIEAPNGYRLASDVEFTIPLTKQDDLITVTMKDKKKPSGGGGGGTTTTPTVTFYKYDGLTMKALTGAEFTIYDANGKVYTTVTTNANGYATVSFSSTGKYTYKETKAPDGYDANDAVYELNITSTTGYVEHVANYETPQIVTIKKADAETGEGIKNVRFEITDESGNVVYTATTDDYGLISFKPGQYGAYAVRETNVPDEYELSDGYITFTVKHGGVEGETTFYNIKHGKPEIPSPGKKGFIDASYNNDANGYGNGWFDHEGKWHPFPGKDKTGDYYPFMALAGMFTIGLAGFAVTRRKKGEEDAQK